MRTSLLPQSLIEICQKKLIQTKRDLLNRIRETEISLRGIEKSTGDEMDQSVAHTDEAQFLIQQDRQRHQLFEIESALGRIEMGTFGICEETDETIEQHRLQALPWTRLSIEGAELREAVGRKFISL
ncbi:MAG: TraR/DksA C4-type zinc finger protein [Bdellovibrionota bacterium]